MDSNIDRNTWFCFLRRWECMLIREGFGYRTEGSHSVTVEAPTGTMQCGRSKIHLLPGMHRRIITVDTTVISGAERVKRVVSSSLPPPRLPSKMHTSPCITLAVGMIMPEYARPALTHHDSGTQARNAEFVPFQVLSFIFFGNTQTLYSIQ